MQDEKFNIEKENMLYQEKNFNEKKKIDKIQENNSLNKRDEDILKIKNEFENINKDFINKETQKDNVQSYHKTKYRNNFKNFKILEKVPVDIVVELGKKKIKIKDLLKLKKGSILTLNKIVGEELNILINNHVIAKGEIVVTDEQYGIRITHIE